MNPPFVPEGAKVLTIGELTREVKGLLEGAHPRGVWVSGEVSNLARPSSGHVYLTLKDAESQLRAVIYRGVALRLRFDLHDGMEVIARGRLSSTCRGANTSYRLRSCTRRASAPLELAFQQLKEKLFGLGYFDKGRKKPLPRFPGAWPWSPARPGRPCATCSKSSAGAGPPWRCGSARCACRATAPAKRSRQPSVC